VQLYASAPGSRVDRAPADLRAFARVELDPAETQTVALQIRLDDLRFWDEAAGAWELEPLTYELRVAQHSADPGVVVTYTVE
jgi:beta-glucosidase